MSDSDTEKNKAGKKDGNQSPASTAPVARLTTGGSGELRVVERVVRETETSTPSPPLRP